MRECDRAVSLAKGACSTDNSRRSCNEARSAGNRNLKTEGRRDAMEGLCGQGDIVARRRGTDLQGKFLSMLISVSSVRASGPRGVWAGKMVGQIAGGGKGGARQLTQYERCRMAARLGLEPRQNESESFVLPLHHRAVERSGSIYPQQMEPAMGFEPATACLQNRCSTIELRRRLKGPKAKRPKSFLTKGI